MSMLSSAYGRHLDTVSSYASLAFQKAALSSVRQFSKNVDEMGGLTNIAKLGELVDASGGAENINSNLVLFKEVTQRSGGPARFTDGLKGMTSVATAPN
jgi:hypothetical protein